MHRVGMRSAQSALTLPYNDDEDDGELIVIVDETGFLFLVNVGWKFFGLFPNWCCQWSWLGH